jgi:hypothetical protein
MELQKIFKKLCTPAQIYLALSALTVASICMQNIGNSGTYTCGLMNVDTPINNVIYFIFKIAYVIIWTYILNTLCKKGFNKLSWLLVLLPYVGMFVIIGLIILSLKYYH